MYVSNYLCIEADYSMSWIFYLQITFEISWLFEPVVESCELVTESVGLGF